MVSRALFLSAVLAVLAVASAFMPGPLLAPALRTTSRNAALTVCMGRKGAQTGQGGTRTKTVTRVRKTGGVAIIRTKKVAGDVTKSVVLDAIDSATKDNFSSEVLSAKIETFMKEEAGSSMYPKLMRKIKAKAKHLGASVPDRWAYEAMATQYQREKLAEKNAAPAEEAAEEGAAAE